MKTHLALRWVLPGLQLLICFAVLWPVRNFLLFELNTSIDSYAPKKMTTQPEIKGQIYIPSLTPEEERAAAAVVKLEDLRMRAPIVLDFPVLVAQLPYILLRPIKREWVPRGMTPDCWRAISWPFWGIVFWWMAGRGIEALLAARRSVSTPKISRAETVIAAILLCFGVVSVIGIVTSTPADRGDLQFMALLLGSWIWGLLAVTTIAARILQGRLTRAEPQARADALLS